MAMYDNVNFSCYSSPRYPECVERDWSRFTKMARERKMAQED